MQFTAVTFEVSHGVARLTLDRPDNMNSINAAMYDDIVQAIEEAARDECVQVLFLTGSGSRAFCVGVDLHARGEESSVTPERTLFRDLHPDRTLISLLIRFEKPLIVAVNGTAVGGGLAIALCADIILAADTAKFGTAHVHLALPLVDMLGYLLPRRVNLGFASEMAFTGRLIDSTEARENGLIDRVVPSQDLSSVSAKLCEEIAANAPLSLQFSKQALRRATTHSADDYARYERYIFGVAYSSDDAREAVRAAREKRAPRFTGR